MTDEIIFNVTCFFGFDLEVVQCILWQIGGSGEQYALIVYLESVERTKRRKECKITVLVNNKTTL